MQHTPDQAFVEEVLAHGRKQLEKGWTPLSIAKNLSARYGLTQDCGTRIVGAMLASRFGPTVDHLAGELATALELSMEEATARVMEVRKGFTDPDDWTTIVLEFDPERTSYYRPAPSEGDEPSDTRTRVAGTRTGVDEEGAAEGRTGEPPAAREGTPKLRGPIRLEINLKPDQDDEPPKGRGLFGRKR